jgi:ABC-type multidrug transport system ATPase subunit
MFPFLFFFPGRTTIMVAHKLNTVKECDWIYLLRKGRITEEGTYTELMENKGFFSKLVHMHAGTNDSAQLQFEDEEVNHEKSAKQSERELRRYTRRKNKELEGALAFAENNIGDNGMSLL